MQKILYITTQDRFFLSHIKNRALFAQCNGFKVYVAAQKTNQEHIEEIEGLGFIFYDTCIERQSISLGEQICAINRLRTIYEKVKPNVVHQLGAKAIIYGTLASKFAKLKSVPFIVNAPIGMGYIYAAKTAKARCLRPLVDLLYCLTLNSGHGYTIFENPDDMAYFVKKRAVRKSEAICIYGAGVNTNVFSPSKNKNDLLTVVMASRLIREKGVLEFVQAANILNANNVKVRMQLLGEPDFGNPNSLTEEEWHDIQINKNIEYLGCRNDIENVFRSAHVCCLPSYYREGIPRVLIEGLCSGLAIITTDTIGCKETVTNENGYLIPPRNVDSLVQAILEMVNNPVLCREMGKKSRELALSVFDERLVCEETLKIYNKSSNQK